ncbi:hypothetical protein RUM44_006516 [Polyplax serrata]|uniref:Uncharacterized protein n=1 Tax=Polyplax serrata TaxID=468196 RepID=A0ABR1AIB0_POLSC
MTELIQRQNDWSPERKRTKLEDVEEMDVDGVASRGEDMMIVDDEFVEMCSRQVETMDITNGPVVLFNLGRNGPRGCLCCRRYFKKYCRNKWLKNFRTRGKLLKLQV